MRFSCLDPTRRGICAGMGVLSGHVGGLRRVVAKGTALAMLSSTVVVAAALVPLDVGSVSAQGGGTPCAGSFLYRMKENGDLAIVYDQFPSPNDNSYGDNSV